MPKAEQGPSLAVLVAHAHTRADCVQRELHDPDPTPVCLCAAHTLPTQPCPMRAIPVLVSYPRSPGPISTMAALFVFLSVHVLVCVCVCICFFCALSFGKQETQIETQAETSFPLWRDIALHLRTERNRSGSFSRSLEQPPQQPPPVCSGSGSASARHLPAGVPLASHREKVYFMNSHKYWDWVLEIRLGQPGPATCSFGAFATATDTGILAH